MIRRRALIALTAMVLATAACAGDSPEAMTAAVEVAAVELPGVADDEGSCAADVIMREVGFDAIAEAGITSTGLEASPQTITEIVALANDAESLDAGIASCVDADRVFRAAMADVVSDPLECTDPFERDNELVDSALTAALAGEDHEVEIDDTPETRDLFRPCLSESDFALTFGLDDASQLRTAIADELPDDLPVDAECASERIMASFGVEVLNDLDVRIDSPAIDPADFDEDELVDSMSDCDTIVDRWSFVSANPSFGECVADAIEVDDEWRHGAIRRSLGQNSAKFVMDRRADRAIDDCMKARVETLDLDDPDPQLAGTLAEWIHTDTVEWDPGAETYGWSLAEYECAAHAITDELTRSEILQVWGFTNSDALSDDVFFGLVDRYWASLAEGLRGCAGDWNYVAGDLVRAGFSESTMACTREAFGREAEAAEVFNAIPDDESEDALVEWGLAFDAEIEALDEALESCMTEDEVDVKADYDEWFESDPYAEISGEDGGPIET